MSEPLQKATVVGSSGLTPCRLRCYCVKGCLSRFLFRRLIHRFILLLINAFRMRGLWLRARDQERRTPKTSSIWLGVGMCSAAYIKALFVSSCGLRCLFTPNSVRVLYNSCSVITKLSPVWLHHALNHSMFSSPRTVLGPDTCHPFLIFVDFSVHGKRRYLAPVPMAKGSAFLRQWACYSASWNW